MNIGQIATKEDLRRIERLIEDIKLPLTGTRWIRTNQVEELYGLSESTLKRLKASRKVVTSKIGNVVYYDVDSIESLLEMNKLEVV